ncbi:hypothetical protein ACWGJT_23575 [Streptomyces xantholiticus]
MNVALHGLEQATGCQYTVRAEREPGATPGTPVLASHADDFVVLCHHETEVYLGQGPAGGLAGPEGPSLQRL